MCLKIIVPQGGHPRSKMKTLFVNFITFFSIIIVSLSLEFKIHLNTGWAPPLKDEFGRDIPASRAVQIKPPPAVRSPPSGGSGGPPVFRTLPRYDGL